MSSIIIRASVNINIKATKTSLTPAIKQFVEDKLGTLSKFLRPEDKIHVELEVNKKHHSGSIFRAEIDIQPHGHYAEAVGEDLYAAFDLVIPKIKEQLVKKKDKRLSERRKARQFRRRGKLKR
ncbi:MAG: ribosome-associated translation inhibitor RaiA [Candidatus Doudnabacteria bacterium]|nr:ribosome-associated translation inhibitor RaiA [Candidatus Doudnabacteria bacterium]